MTNQTLAREFWRGQVHGAGLDKHPIHARHLRTRCLSISLGKKTHYSTDSSILIFLRRYWPEDSNRAKFSFEATGQAQGFCSIRKSYS